MLHEIIAFSHWTIKEFWTVCITAQVVSNKNFIMKPQQLISVSNSFFIVVYLFIVYWTVFQNWDFMEEVGSTQQFRMQSLLLALHFSSG